MPKIDHENAAAIETVITLLQDPSLEREDVGECARFFHALAAALASDPAQIPDAVLPNLLDIFTQRQNNLGLCCHIATILLQRWSANSDVLDLLEESLFSCDTHPQVKLHWTTELQKLLERDPSMSQKVEIRSIIQKAHLHISLSCLDEMCTRDSLAQIQASVQLLRILGLAEIYSTHCLSTDGGSEKIFLGNKIILNLRADAALRTLLPTPERQTWITKLSYVLTTLETEEFCDLHALRQEIIHTICALQDVEDEPCLSDQDVSDETPTSTQESLVGATYKKLSQEELVALSEEERHKPEEIFLSLLQESPLLFVEIHSRQAFLGLENICRNLVTQNSLTHVALNIPEAYRQDFEILLQGGESEKLQQFLRGSDPHAHAHYEAIVEVLQAIDAMGITWSLVGSTAPAEGMFGECAQHIGDIVATNPEAKTIIIDCASLPFPGIAMSRVDSTEVHSGKMVRSLPKAVANNTSVACVRMLGESNGITTFRNGHPPNAWEVGQICNDLDIEESFGVVTAQSVLGKLPPNNSMRENYSETYDALIFIVEKNDDNPRRPPEAQDSPVPGPVMVA